MNSSTSSDVPLLMVSLLFIMLGLAVSQTNNSRAARSSVFTIVNNCNYTVWPGVLTNVGPQTFPTTGFILEPGDSTSISIPRTWTGQIWGRTLCTRNSTSGNFSCLTGDCGSSTIECSGRSAIRSATLAEFTFGQTPGQDFYDVSLVKGYNLPIMISPHRVTGGDCTSVGCTKDLNAVCPRELKVVNGSDTVACDSPCDVFEDPQSTCKPTNYSRFFKNLCPAAYTYPQDDATSLFTCSAADYDITFCPPPSNSSNLRPSPAPTPTYECRDSNECRRSSLQPSPASTPTYTPNNNNRRGSKSKLNLTPIFIGLGVTVIVLVSAVSFIILRYKGKSLSNLLGQGSMNDNARIEAFIAKFGSIAPNRYSYGEIKKITNKFKDKLGQGGFGSVYKGKLPDGRIVAVKVLSETKGNGEDFMNEVASISRTSHVNIVTLLGFCFEKSKRALIYEFMPKGSLDKFIYSQGTDNESRLLDWKTLYDIALGIARGLEYLHQGCNTRILHFDIKPQNILLDEYFCPKIADFGLSKLCERKESVISMTGARGTAGYIAPEVYSRNLGGVSHKSDVYSYGMMVLEMVGGRRNIDVEVSKTSEIYYPTWIYKHLDQPTNLNDFTEEITEEDEIKKKLIAVSLSCIQTNPLDRPSITKVLEMLQGSLQSLVLPSRPP